MIVSKLLYFQECRPYVGNYQHDVATIRYLDNKSTDMCLIQKFSLTLVVYLKMHPRCLYLISNGAHNKIFLGILAFIYGYRYTFVSLESKLKIHSKLHAFVAN